MPAARSLCVFFRLPKDMLSLVNAGNTETKKNSSARCSAPHLVYNPAHAQNKITSARHSAWHFWNNPVHACTKQNCVRTAQCTTSWTVQSCTRTKQNYVRMAQRTVSWVQSCTHIHMLAAQHGISHLWFIQYTANSMAAWYIVPDIGFL